MTFIFDKLALPLNMCFKRCFKSLFIPFKHKKVSEELKTWYFPNSAFWLTGRWGGGGYSLPCPSPGYATAFSVFIHFMASVHERIIFLPSLLVLAVILLFITFARLFLELSLTISLSLIITNTFSNNRH